MGILIVNTRNSERGFSLLEVLITVTVISIGLLGLAGLQVAGVRIANSAHEHTLATLLAQDIAERVRSDRAGAGGYDGLFLDRSSRVSATKNCTAPANDCTPDELKAFDRYQWYRLIVPSTGPPLLPGLWISIELQGVSRFEVKLGWADPSGPRTLTSDFSL